MRLVSVLWGRRLMLTALVFLGAGVALLAFFGQQH
jgi:hypothetical protein